MFHSKRLRRKAVDERHQVGEQHDLATTSAATVRMRRREVIPLVFVLNGESTRRLEATKRKGSREQLGQFFLDLPG